jgi:hypothetical protein
MPKALRLLSPVALTVLLSASFAILRTAPAIASGSQETIFQDDTQLLNNTSGTLALLQSLGVERVRVFLSWSSIAPSPGSTRKPRNFTASDPGSYPTANWARYDNLIRTAKADKIGIDLTLTSPIPLWASGGGFPGGGPRSVWRPSGSEFGAFVRAVGKRYSGSYVPTGASTALPAIRYWAVWNEPNYGSWLAPQATRHSTVEVSPATYRGLVDSAWSSLHQTGHGGDKFLFGEVAPRGQTFGDQPGNFSGMVPLRFLRALYCVDGSYAPLRGSAAAARGCPTNSAGSRRFRSAHPALFQATGFADHPYPQGLNPVTHTWPNPGADQYADMPQIPALEGLLDRVNRVYGSGTRFNIYSTEFGQQTSPPISTFRRPSPATAAVYINWAEYLSWRNPRMASYMQYGLVDPPLGNFPSALEFANGKHKALYDAFRLPLFLPSSSSRRGRSLEVWGCARPAHLGSGKVAIQFQRGSHGTFKTVKTVTVSVSANSRGYFDVRVAFPASGSVRLAWSDTSGTTYHSRTQQISVR